MFDTAKLEQSALNTPYDSIPKPDMVNDWFAWDLAVHNFRL
jgi:hypothetical protein